MSTRPSLKTEFAAVDLAEVGAGQRLGDDDATWVFVGGEPRQGEGLQLFRQRRRLFVAGDDEGNRLGETGGFNRSPTCPTRLDVQTSRRTDG